MTDEPRPKILVVDDDAGSRVAVRAVLDDLDLEVVEATSGEEALKEVLRHDFSMIFLDVRLTGIDGFKTAAILRERNASRDIPIIFLTGLETDAAMVNRGYDLGAVNYMIKPIVPHSLRAKVRFSIKYHVQLLASLKLAALEKERLASEEQAKLVEALARSNRALDEFAYIASHDLKDPLRGITINGNSILQDTTQPEVETRARRIVDLGQRMDRLISDLLEYSRLARSQVEAEAIDPKPIICEIAGLFEELRDGSAARLIFDTELPKLVSDPARVRTIFHNLISNGLKYNQAREKRINIGYETREGTGGYYVRDNGIGIEPRFHDRVLTSSPDWIRVTALAPDWHLSRRSLILRAGRSPSPPHRRRERHSSSPSRRNTPHG